AGLEGGGWLEEDAREEHAQDGAAGGREAGEDRAPGGERKQVAARPDVVAALRLRNPWVSAGHRGPSAWEPHQKSAYFLSRRRPRVKAAERACDGSPHVLRRGRIDRKGRRGYRESPRRVHGTAAELLGDRVGARQHPHRLHAGAGRVLHLA